MFNGFDDFIAGAVQENNITVLAHDFDHEADRNGISNFVFIGDTDFENPVVLHLLNPFNDSASNKIIEAIKHVGFSQNSYRTILPGSTYIAPPKTDAVNPFTIGDEALFALLHKEELSPKNLQKCFQGLGRDTAQELAKRLETDEKLKTFRAFFEAPSDPHLTTKSFSAIPFADASSQTFETLSDLLDDYYRDKAERDRVQQQASELIRKVENDLEKNRKKLAKQEAELVATDNAEEFRQKGELLTTFLHQVPNDQDQVMHQCQGCLKAGITHRNIRN